MQGGYKYNICNSNILNCHKNYWKSFIAGHCILTSICTKIWRDAGGGHWLVRMEWRPAGWSVYLPLLIFPCTIKSRSSLPALDHPGAPGKRAVKQLWWYVPKYIFQPDYDCSRWESWQQSLRPSSWIYMSTVGRWRDWNGWKWKEREWGKQWLSEANGQLCYQINVDKSHFMASLATKSVSYGSTVQMTSESTFI